MNNSEILQDYIIRIADFARAITLDDCYVAGSLAKTMASEIQDYASKALEIIEK